MPPVSAISSLILVLSVFASGMLHAKVAYPQEHHAWARFLPGAWTRVRIVTETLGDQGKVTAVTTRETKTTLVSKEQDNYTLQIETTVEVAGRRFAADPQVVTRGFLGEAPGEVVSIHKTSEGSVTINGQKFPCEIREIEIRNNEEKRLCTLHYSSRVFPYILKNEIKAFSSEQEQPKSETSMEVIAFDMPWKVLANIHRSAHIRSVYHEGRINRVTLDIHCEDVPGGMVAQTWKETDETGKLLRRSTLEIIDYGQEDAATQSRVFGRRLFHRAKMPKRSR